MKFNKYLTAEQRKAINEEWSEEDRYRLDFMANEAFKYSEDQTYKAYLLIYAKCAQVIFAVKEGRI